MNGIHDLGGMDGFGPVVVERDEPVFHRPWERTAFKLAVAILGRGIGSGNRYRHAVERMDPAHYLAAPYYERMLTGVATMLVDLGVVAREELERRVPGWVPAGRPARPPRLEPAASDDATATPQPRFAVGARVRVRNVETPGHTRCPRYVRGKRGEVVRVDGSFALPDLEAHTGERRREPTYSVGFDGAELWGTAAEGGESIHVDLWESYLEPDASVARTHRKPTRRARAARKTQR